jgi:hypothetical protein
MYAILVGACGSSITELKNSSDWCSSNFWFTPVVFWNHKLKKKKKKKKPFLKLNLNGKKKNLNNQIFKN